LTLFMREGLGPVHEGRPPAPAAGRLGQAAAEDRGPSPGLEEGRDLLFTALEALGPDSDPAECMATADDAERLCVRLGDWRGASRAGLVALAAWLASGGDTAGRGGPPGDPDARDETLTQLENEPRYRFTAYALFRAACDEVRDGADPGSDRVQSLLEEAVTLLELGRATALRAASGADVGELERLRAVDPGLAESYLSAVRRAREASFAAAGDAPPADGAGPSADGAAPSGDVGGPSPTGEGPGTPEPGPELDALLTAIRGMPTFEGFAQGRAPAVADIRAALDPGQAMVFLIAHPEGCCALAVTAEAPGRPAVLAVGLPGLRGARLMTLTFGFGMGPDGTLDGLTPGRPRPAEGVLVSSDGFHFAGFRLTLPKVLAELGTHVARPLARALKQAGVTDVVLVPCGRLPVFAWHAASWREGRRPTSLGQELDSVSYAPSAGVWMAARARAARLAGRRRRLVGLADPARSKPRLPGTRAELQYAAELFGPDSSTAYDAEATSAFLLRELPRATHLYLGCHGRIRYDTPDNASLLLAEGEELSLTRIRRLTAHDTRLVVVAACVSGAMNLFWQPEETPALALGFMHAGAAGVLATLWPIPDAPTVLFVSRFYELLTTDPRQDPARALARTQQWMRTLTRTGARRYVAERPALKARRGSGLLRGPEQQDPGRPTRPVRQPPLSRLTRPYAGPEYWAGFVLQGC
jgi:hypothetical protein